MEYLKNNGIALAIHIYLGFIFYLLRFWKFSDRMSSTAANLLILVVYSIIYVVFGFFMLRPVEKFRFLSLVSVPVVLTALYLYLSFSPNRDISSLLIIGNLGGAAGISLLGAKPGALMFVMLPSVMMYLGMILRRYLQAGDLCMAHWKNNGIALKTVKLVAKDIKPMLRKPGKSWFKAVRKLFA